MGCIHTIDNSSLSKSKSPRNSTKKQTPSHPHSRCETSEPPPSDLESTTACSTDVNNIPNNNPNTSKSSINKPLKINTNISVLSESNTANIPSTHNTKKQRIYHVSNSSIISNSATLPTIPTVGTTIIDGAILSHIHNNRIIPNYTIDEDVEEDNIMENYCNSDLYNISCRSSPNNSPISPPKQLQLQDNISNTLQLNEDEMNEYKSTLKIQKPNAFKNKMNSAPIFPFEQTNIKSMSSDNLKKDNRYPMERFKRSKSCDPTKDKYKQRNNNKLSVYAYNNKGQINTTKSKRKLVHAKSKSIPQNIFSSELGAYQNEEMNNYEYLSQITHFDQNTLRLLHLRFKSIHKIYGFYYNTNVNNDINDREQIQYNTTIKLDINAIALILGLPSDCILVKRFFNYMDEHRMGQLSFRVFARTMSILSDKASINEKCEFSFNLYDINNDKLIDKQEIKQLIEDLLINATDFMDPELIKLISNNKEEFISQLINNTMKQFDLDLNGNITYNSYLQFMIGNPRLLSPYILDIEKLLDFDVEKRRMKRISINSLKKKQLRQMVIGTDPKKKYNKKWKKPQFIKDLEKDQIQNVEKIINPNQICFDLFENNNNTLNQLNENESNSNDSEIDINIKAKEEKLKEERMQRTIDFLYD